MDTSWANHSHLPLLTLTLLKNVEPPRKPGAGPRPGDQGPAVLSLVLSGVRGHRWRRVSLRTCCPPAWHFGSGFQAINLGWAAPEDTSRVRARLQSSQITRVNSSPVEPVIAAVLRDAAARWTAKGCLGPPLTAPGSLRPSLDNHRDSMTSAEQLKPRLVLRWTAAVLAESPPARQMGFGSTADRRQQGVLAAPQLLWTACVVSANLVDTGRPSESVHWGIHARARAWASPAAARATC